MASQSSLIPLPQCYVRVLNASKANGQVQTAFRHTDGGPTLVELIKSVTSPTDVYSSVVNALNKCGVYTTEETPIKNGPMGSLSTTIQQGEDFPLAYQFAGSIAFAYLMTGSNAHYQAMVMERQGSDLLILVIANRGAPNVAQVHQLTADALMKVPT